MTLPVTRAAAVLPSGGAWLRLFLGAAVAALFAVAWVPTDIGALRFGEIAVMVLAGLAVVAAPGSAFVLIALAAVVADRIFAGSARLDGQLLGLAVLVPLVHQLAALAAVVPPRSTLRFAALLPTALRYVGSVLLTLLIMIIAGLTITPFA